MQEIVQNKARDIFSVHSCDSAIRSLVGARKLTSSSECRKGGVWSGGVCRHTKTARTVRTAKTVNGLEGCVTMPFSLALLSASIAGGKNRHKFWPRTVKTVKTAKTVKRSTPLRPHPPFWAFRLQPSCWLCEFALVSFL